MVLMVENEEVTGRLNNHRSEGESATGFSTPADAASQRSPGNKLYADYMRREGRSSIVVEPTQDMDLTAKERRDVDDQFKDF